jgi:radical SAM protein with 4Fe4S-binding SPASM domain
MVDDLKRVRHRKYPFRQRLKLLKGYLRGETIPSAMPSHLIVEGTARCNLKCPMCPRQLQDFPAQDMDWDLFCKIVDEGKNYLEFIIPFGGGEPLLGKDIFRMIDYCRQQGLRTWISTNATLLDENRSRELLRSGLDYIIFAFDGATADVYQRYRPGADFHRVRQNILRFLELKKKMASTIFCVIQMVRLQGNAHQTADFRRMWQTTGIDEIRIKEDEVCRYDTPKEKRKPPRRRPCRLLWRGPLYVRYDGEVFPCCYAFQGPSLGNLNTTTLAEIWTSPQLQAMRTAHHQGDLSDFKICQRCHVRQPYRPLLMISFLADSLWIRKWIPLVERLSSWTRLRLFEDS